MIDPEGRRSPPSSPLKYTPSTDRHNVCTRAQVRAQVITLFWFHPNRTTTPYDGTERDGAQISGEHTGESTSFVLTRSALQPDFLMTNWQRCEKRRAYERKTIVDSVAGKSDVRTNSQ
jgi:hypothetical protein